MTRMLTLCLLLTTLGWGSVGASAADELMLPLEQGSVAWTGSGGEDSRPDGSGTDRDPLGPRTDLLDYPVTFFSSRFQRAGALSAPALALLDAHRIRAPPLQVTIV